MADSAVRFLREYVELLLQYNRNLISGAENELCNLVTDLDLLRVYIGVAAKKEKKGPWGEREIKEVVYELEDTIDAHLTDAAAAKRHVKSLPEKLKDLRIRKVRAPLDACLTTLSLSDAPSTSRERQPRPRFRPNKVVGFEDEKETIIGYLIEPKEKLDFITIVGMRGQGKTTLAREIYHDDRIAYEFPIRFWTRVSPNSKYRGLFLNILKVFSGQDMSNLNDQKLIETCQACLEKGKFLLVLDGVCRLDDWIAIKNILPHSNGKSRVLITTCNNYVGANPGHKLRLLTTRESWKLLQLEVFGNLEDCPRELEEIGKIIADKCGGLPLQIVAVGGILAGLGSTKMEWKKVSENKNLFVQNGISNAIELTYTTLPDDLRECFLYMGVFPEDYEIPVWTLTCLWIAEGFVRPDENGQSLEESATQNLYDLINRNLVMADRINPIGEVKTCRIPDMIRAFCVQKAREHNLFRDVKRPDADAGVSRSQLQKCRRLCVHSDVNAFLSQVPEITWVRSLLCFHKEHASSNPSISDGFILLRVLESRSIKYDLFPTRITQVIHLRYITLSVDDLRILPRSLSKIWNLQCLVVDTASRIITMEADLWRLIGLRHLKTNAAIVLLSDGEGKAGENLQTLNTLSPKSCTTHMSKRAHNLKTLRIKGEVSSLPQNRFLENFVGLEKLKLVNDSFPYQNPVHGLTLPNCFPPNLRRLTLSNTFLKWSHMSTLAKIDTLEVLKLKDNAFTGVSWRVEKDCFCSLLFLLIADADLAIWEASTDSLPRLTCLVLKKCGNLHRFPQTLKSLEKLEIERVNKSALKCARRIAEQKAMSGFPIKLSIAPGHGY